MLRSTITLTLATGVYAGADALARDDTVLLVLGSLLIGAAAIAGGHIGYLAMSRARRASRIDA